MNKFYQARIFDGLDRAREMGLETYRDLIRFWTEEKRKAVRQSLRWSQAKVRDALARVRDWSGGVDEAATPVIAYIDGGRWSARCECGNREYVTSADPIFFCHECGNREFAQQARRVYFPEHHKQIEKELLKRPVPFEILNTQDAASVHPTLRLDWYSDMTLKDLKQQNKEFGL